MTARAIETTATIDDDGHLQLDEALPADHPKRVRIIVLWPEGADVTESQWLGAATRNPAFDFLASEAEDIYSAADGRPFGDPR
jgi:hypothetical protein